jgi:hypothetical protein
LTLGKNKVGWNEAWADRPIRRLIPLHGDGGSAST